MDIVQIRNATLLLRIAEHRLIVDPMLGDPATMPGFLLDSPRPNPLVALPANAEACLDEATGVIVTHEHPDHLDSVAIEWIRARSLPVWASPADVPSLRRRGLDAHPLLDGALGLRIEETPADHGRGALGFRMGPAAGVYLDHPDEPSLLLTGDTVLTPRVLRTLIRLRPDVTVAPAGSANFGAGGDILFSVDELQTLAAHCDGVLILNHLEALDHCPTTRAELRDMFRTEHDRVAIRIPDDGETITIDAAPERRDPPPLRRRRAVWRRRLQKRIKTLL
ncbi:MAG: MBL fold metallo-hydrolase [Phycisphaerales bacterium]